jgi:hypothetical protein
MKPLQQISVTFSVVALLATQPSFAQVAVTDLGSLGCGYTAATGINARGEVDNLRGVLWTTH